jgi:F-type H+-transporting ATPase subunit epsilon
MTNQLQFELVSPEKLLISKAVAMVTVPGGEGDYGVLAGHAPLITNVRPGVITVYEQQDNVPSERIFVTGGFAEVTTERCTVLAVEAIPVADLNRVELEEEAKNLTSDLAQAQNDVDRTEIETQLTIVKSKLQAVSN